MGLLPDEEGTCIRGRLTSPGVGHLHPAHTFETLALGYLTGYGIGHLVIPLEHLCHNLRLIPQGKVDGMPPRHLQMGASEPGVIGETRLLRRHIVGAINLGEVLREHHATLQLLGTGIGTLGEVDDRSVDPPVVPMALGLLVVLVVFKPDACGCGHQV